MPTIDISSVAAVQELSMIDTPRVSLCLIVRNEAANLRACLQHTGELFHEIVVVDTGSTDDTIAIARELGAYVVERAWTDDFAAARNAALESATGDWIFWLDADDRLDLENRERLAALLRRLEVTKGRQAFVMTTRSRSRHSTEPDTLISHVRLFRADPRIRWRGRVHEQIAPAIEALGDSLIISDVQIDHVGYLDPALCQRKANRDLRLLRMEYATDPDDPATLFWLGATYLRIGQMHQALTHLLKSLQRVTTRGDWVRRLYALIVETLINLGRREEAFGMTTEALQFFPGDPELTCRRADLFCEFNDLGSAERLLTDLLSKPRSPALLHGADSYVDGREAQALLGRIYRETHRWDAATQLFQRLLAEHPTWIPAWVNLGYAYLAQHRWSDVEYAARQIDKCLQGEAYALVLRSEALSARGDLPAARRLVEKAIALAPRLAWARIVLGEILLKDGSDREACIGAHRDILRLQPGYAHAQQILNQLTSQVPPERSFWPYGWSLTVNP